MEVALLGATTPSPAGASPASAPSTPVVYTSVVAAGFQWRVFATPTLIIPYPLEEEEIASVVIKAEENVEATMVFLLFLRFWDGRDVVDRLHASHEAPQAEGAAVWGPRKGWGWWWR